MSKKRQRRLTLVGISTVIMVWVMALALLFSQPGAQSARDVLPTLASPLDGVVSLPNTGGLSPTLLPTDVPIDPPAGSNSLIAPVSFQTNQNQTPAQVQPTNAVKIPDQPVPNSMVIRFKPEMTEQERLAYITSLGGQIVQEIEALNTVIISVPDKAASSAQIQSAVPGIVENEPDYYAGALASPNDALAAGQWGLETVKAPEAWDLLPLTTPTITVAVIDSGVCADHADLQGRIVSGGWDFVQGDSTPQDEYGHGCAVSGIIAANSNNGLGIAGVAPNTAIMPLRVLDATGLGRYSNVAAAIVYAVDHGAEAINLSLGGPNESSVLQDAVNYAESHGVTVIAAAGNAGTDSAYYPAAYPQVVAVGSVDQTLQRSAFSNYGPDVDIYAPGSNIMTTSLDGSFQTFSGTSVAAPYVTGVWALRKAMGKSLVLDGGIVSALYDNETPVATEPPTAACPLSDMNAAGSTYFDLVQQNAAQPGSVSADQLDGAKSTYLSLAGQCANVMYNGTITIDGGGISPVSGEVAPQFQLFGTKWGSDSPFNRSRPPAAPVTSPVTYSFMPTGVSLAAKESENGGGAGVLITSIADLPGSSQCNLQDRIEQVFTAWSQVANITFQRVDETGLVPFGSTGQIGDLRIGAQPIDGMTKELAHAYYPPPDPDVPTSTRSGDIFLDQDEMWGCAPGEIQVNGQTVRVIDIGLVALHEVGHALGMQHEAADQQLALMNPTYKAELLNANNNFSLSDGLQPDDKSGIQSIYGATGVSAPAPISPVGTDVNDNTPTFTWTDTTNGGSNYFEVQVYTNQNNQPGGLVFDGTTDGGTDPTGGNSKSFTIQTSLESLAYLWRVRSFVNADWGPWSSYQAFSVTVGIASLRRPVEGETLGSGPVNFEWSPIIGDNSFRLEVATRPEFTAPLTFAQDGIQSTQFVLSTALADGTYYWRVRGSNSSLFSRVGRFIVDTSTPIVDLSAGNGAVQPANGSSQPNQNVVLSWPTLPGIDEYQVQVDTSENFAGLLYLDRVFLDRVFLDRVFLDRVFLDRVFLDRVFLDRVFLDRVFLDRVFLDRVFLDRVFLDRVFLDRVFLDRVFLDRVFLDRVFLDRYSLDKVFLDRVFLDRLLFDKVIANGGTASVTLAELTSGQRVSEGTHYWRVRARLADGTFGPWSVGRKFEVHTQPSKVVINEIKLTDPSWVEFHNTGTQAADLTNWKFFAYGPNGETDLLYTFPAGFTLPPNGYVVLYEGQGTNTDRALFTGGSQIDWPLTAQTALADPAAVNQMVGVVPAVNASVNVDVGAVVQVDANAQTGDVSAQGGTDQNFSIQIGDTVLNGVPSAGAGNIEHSGSRDFYTFSGTAGQKIFFDALSASNNHLKWRLTNPSNMQIFNIFINVDGGQRTLPTTGTYTIRVSSDEGETGTYSFRIYDVNPTPTPTYTPTATATYTPTPTNTPTPTFTPTPTEPPLTGDLTVTTTSMTFNQTDGLCSLPEAIKAANTDAPADGAVQGECVPAGGADTITLGSGLTYTLGVVDHVLPSNGSPNGLPAISSAIIINGNGSTIKRDSEAQFRLFYVAPEGSLTLNNLTLTNGFGDPGGAVFSDGVLTLNFVSVANNKGSSGGGIFVTGPTFINNSAITGNQAVSPDGGGIFVQGTGTLKLSNSTVAGNFANGLGAGIVTGFGSSVVVQIYNSTIANNVAMGGGSGIAVYGGSATIYNTIVANNFAADGVTPNNCTGTVQAGSGFTTNLQWPDFSCTDSISSADPLLGPLTGSPAYLPLSVDSPAIDAADSTICQAAPVSGIDQRGVSRPLNACDIGAIEASEAPALVAGTVGGAASLVSPAGTQDFVRFGDTTLGPIEGIEWRGDNVAIPSSNTFNIGRDPVGSDTNHVTDWLSQGSSAGGQNFAKAIINEVYTGTNDLVELYNPIIDTVDLSGWELTLYDSNDQIIPLGAPYTYRFPNGTLLRPGKFLVISETNPGDGVDAVLLGANTINWDDWNATGAVLLTNGAIPMDFMRFGGSTISPLMVDAPTGTAFTGIVSAPLPGESMGRNADSEDSDAAIDWYSQSTSFGAINPTLNPPDNDVFADATEVNPLPFRDTGDNLNATATSDPITSCGFGVGHTVWYKYTAANGNPVRFQTDGSDFNTVLAVFTLDAGTNSLQQVSGLCSVKNDATGSRLTLNPTAGTIYYIMLGGQLNDSGSYVFSANAPVNDDIDDAVTIGALPFMTFQLNAQDIPISNTNLTAASQLVADPATACATTVGRSVWYKYTAPDASTIRLQTNGTDFDTVIAIYMGNLGDNGKIDRQSLVEVACNNDDTNATTSDMGFTPVAGTTYYIMVAGNSDAGGNLLFKVSPFPTPANDLRENAYNVIPNTDPMSAGTFKIVTPGGEISAPFAEDTTGATATGDATASCGMNLGASVWFKYTDVADAETNKADTVVFQTFGGNYDTTMTIYTLDGSTLTEVGCSDDVGVNDGSRLMLGSVGADITLVEGQTYYIRVSGYFSETGDLIFTAFTPQATPPQNDEPTSPYTIHFDSGTGNYTIEGVTDPLNIRPFVQDTTGANPALEAAAAGLTCGEDVGYTVWYRYQAQERQRVVFDAGGSDFDTVIAAFVNQGTADNPKLVEVGCNDDFGSRPQSRLALNTGDGVELYLMFGGYKQDRGNLKLGVQQIIPVVTDFTLVNASLSGDIRQLTDPDTLNLPSLPPIAVRANTEPSEVGSVVFELRDFDTDALVLSNTDNMFPYSLTGNQVDGSYTPWLPLPGKYKLTATPYADADGQGTVGTPLTIVLTIIGENFDPVITADAASVTVNEGANATNSGTFSDPEGDEVNLTASVGTVTPDLSDPEHLTWDWHFTTTDGPADSQTVTITADDGHGNQTPVTFALVVKNVAPTAPFTPIFVSRDVRALTFGDAVDINADLTTLKYSYDCSFDNDGDEGNDNFDVSNVTDTSYNCTFANAGTYTVRGRIADKDGGFTDYTADVVISPANTAPVVNAGNDQTITLPVNSVSLVGIASDDNLPTGSTLTYTWEAINEPPAPVIFSAPHALETTATFSIAGTYTLQLTASDGELSGSDTMQVIVVPANVPPHADAGDDQTVTDTAPYGAQDVTLDGSGSTDSDGSIVSYVWTEGETLLANTVNPTISLADGVHYITLTVTDDDGAMSSDSVKITVQLPDNTAPLVNAGNDQTIQLPINSVSLSGSATDDGLPLPPNLTYTWTGPAGVSFGTPNAASTSATFAGSGTYELMLTVSDGQLSGNDTVTIYVNAPAVIPPNADAGSDQTVTDTAPYGSQDVMLDGSASTDDGSIVSYVWTEGATVIANGVKPTVALADGIHIITLTVTDNSGATDTDDVSITVQLPANTAPLVNAGSDQDIVLPTNSVSLSGTATDDGLPLPPNLTYTWSGPAGVTFGTPNAASTTATFSAAGTYTLTLTVSDGQLSGSDTLQVVVSPATSNTVSDQIGQSSDDVNEDGSSYDARNAQLWFGTGQTTAKSYMGLRFNNLEIPQGATITEAHIEVYTATSQWIRMRILIGADAVDNSPTFTRTTRPSMRVMTTARMEYRSDTPWMADTWNNIGDVKLVIQEIVNRSGWQSGNSLSILVKGIGSQWGRKFVTSYDGDPAHAPRLVVSYTVPAPAEALVSSQSVPPASAPGPVIISVPTPMVAAFTSSLTGGDAPLAVQFTNTSTGDIAAYSWDFGDGSTSAEVNPAHTFAAGGTYTITLTVTGMSGKSTTAQAVISVTTPPAPTETPTETPTPEPTAAPTDIPTEAATPVPPIDPAPDVADATPPPTDQASSP